MKKATIVTLIVVCVLSLCVFLNDNNSKPHSIEYTNIKVIGEYTTDITAKIDVVERWYENGDSSIRGIIKISGAVDYECEVMTLFNNDMYDDILVSNGNIVGHVYLNKDLSEMSLKLK